MLLPNENNKVSESGDSEQILNQISSILTQNQMAIAAEHARSGNFTAAEEVLGSISKNNLSHDVLELRAKIKAQQMDYESAIKYWNQALKINPSCPECNAGLQRTKSILSSKLPTYWIRRITTLLVFLAGAVLIIYLIFRINKLERLIPQQNTITNIPTVFFQSSKIEEELSFLGSQQESIVEILEEDRKQLSIISEVVREISNTPTPSPEVTTIPSIIEQIKLDTEKITVDVIDEEIEITFDEGLFLYNWLLSEEGKSTLLSLGGELEKWADDIIISVIGFTDSTEEDIPGLSYFRSYKAVEYLTSNCRISEDSFLILPRANRLAPFPNDTITNRQKNRTIIIIITEKSD